MLSYDERGRVEALIRYTENLGFDAVYYKYNSMNRVIRLTVADPLRRYTTWYGYDRNGRVDSVWTRLENSGSGLWEPGTGAWMYNANPINRFGIPEIRYLYTPTNQIDTMWYPRIATYTAYSYSPRKWLDTMITHRLSNDIFKEYLTFDPTGQILQQRSQQGSSNELVQDYSYDALGQLTAWTRNPGTGSQATEDYDYDSVGNRTLLTSRNNMGVVSSWRTYDIGRRTNLSAGPNQMLKSLNRNALAVFNYTTSGYDPDGALTERKLYTGGDVLSQEEQFSYSSWRGLNWKYHRSTPRPSGGPLEWEWRYRYNAMGEREQKREVLTPNGDDVASQGYKWSYYLLGGNKQQLSLWEGLQTSDGTFCSLPGGGGSSVHLYPSEYITNAGSTTGVITKPTSTSSTQEYRIADHLGSNRVVLSGSTGAVVSKADYAPFSAPLGETDTFHEYDENGKNNYLFFILICAIVAIAGASCSKRQVIKWTDTLHELSIIDIQFASLLDSLSTREKECGRYDSTAIWVVNTKELARNNFSMVITKLHGFPDGYGYIYTNGELFVFYGDFVGSLLKATEITKEFHGENDQSIPLPETFSTWVYTYVEGELTLENAWPFPCRK